MPINFNKSDEINRLNDLFNNQTGWGSGVIDIFTDLLSNATNPFGSAALANEGDSANNVPVLDGEGIQEAHLRAASSTGNGAVRLIESTTGESTSDGFPLVMTASLILSILQSADSRTNIIKEATTWRAGSPDFPLRFILPTEPGIVVLVGSTHPDSSGIPLGRVNARLSGAAGPGGQTMFQGVLSPDITFRPSQHGNQFGRTHSSILLSPGQLGGVLRFGILLPGFGAKPVNIPSTFPGHNRGREFQKDRDYIASDLVVGFKETTPAGFPLYFRSASAGSDDNRNASFTFLRM